MTEIDTPVRDDGATRAEDEGHRVLFCFAALTSFYDADLETALAVKEALIGAYADLRGRFGVRVLGTIDDDELVIGPTNGWPWTCYILADLPTIDTAMALCNLIRTTPVGADRLWRYIRVEARIGRQLFFGNE